MQKEKIKAKRTLRLGTRGSMLALAQARIVQDQIERFAPEFAIEVKIIRTSGDKIADRPLRGVSGKGLFVKELEEALIAREIDLAVHSMKDVEMPVPRGLAIACLLEREDPRDVLISRMEKKLQDLSFGARVGTCSPRRAAQLLSLRPDLHIIPLRGNVETRLQKLAVGACDAIVLAYAGLKRIRRTEVITEVLESDTMIPAVAQGVIGVEVRQEDKGLQETLRNLNHDDTEKAVHIESQLLQGFGGDCTTPVAAWARRDTGSRLSLQAMVALPDGSKALKKSLSDDFKALSTEAYALGQEFRAWYTMHTA